MEVLLYVCIAYWIGSLLEWASHRYIMHSPAPFLEGIYRDHTAHHLAYNRGRFNNSLEEGRFIALKLCLEQGTALMLPFAGVFYSFNPLLSIVTVAFTIFHFYLFNEVHTAMHLKHRTWLPRFYLEACAWNHLMHHSHYNSFYCVALPGADWVLGTHCKMTPEDKRDWVRAKDLLYTEDKDLSETDKIYRCLHNLPKYIKDLSTIGFAVESISPLAQKIGKISVKALQYIFVGNIEVRGALPQGQYIYIANHSSWKDIIVHSAILPPIRFMAAQSVMQWAGGLLGLYFGHFLGGFPVAGGKDRNPSIETAVRLYKEGNSLFIYPEGWAYTAGETRNFKYGVLSVQEQTGAQIVPLYFRYGRYPGESRGEESWVYKLPFWAQMLVTALPLYRSNCIVYVGSPIPCSRDGEKNSPETLRGRVLELFISRACFSRGIETVENF